MRPTTCVQVQAACGCGPQSFETVLFLGDEHQRLEDFRHNPALARHPWVGDARDRTADLAESEDVTIDQRDVEVSDSSRGPRRPTTSNPMKRPIHDWLNYGGPVPSAELTMCKRCGSNVCDFIANAFDFAKDFKTDPQVAPDTWLWHVFDNGNDWEPQDTGTNEASPGMVKGKGKGKKGGAWTPIMAIIAP